MSTVSQKVGGVQYALSACDLPRNEQQVCYVKSQRIKVGESCKDPLTDQMFIMMQHANLEDHFGKFVRDCRPSPEPAFIVARDTQLDDLVRFCTEPSGFCVLTVDRTFNLGDFDVTPTAYRNLLLKTVRYECNPVFIGPTMVHYRNTFGTFLFFCFFINRPLTRVESCTSIWNRWRKRLCHSFVLLYKLSSKSKATTQGTQFSK